MSRSVRLFLFMPVFALAGCLGGDGDGDVSDSRQFLAGGECAEPQEVCLATYPPQCYDACPTDPGDDDCDGFIPAIATEDGDPVEFECNDGNCIAHLDENGNPVIICPDDNCVVGHDVESGTTFIECPDGPVCMDPYPGDDGGGSDPDAPDGNDGSEPDCSGGGGSEPGDPGDPGGVEPAPGQ